MSKPITVIIVGAGHRSFIYSHYAVTNPDRLRIVGVADPDAERRRMAQELFSLPDDMLFEDAPWLPEGNLPMPSSTAQWISSTLKPQSRC